jgi:threonine/homoserine/homoserine lactone efflux protein
MDEELVAERSLVRAILRSIAVSVPVMVAFFVTLISVAVSTKDPDWGVWLGMGACVGLLAGVFFGAWAGFVRSSHALDEIDRQVGRRQASARTSDPAAAANENKEDG